jgi:hypothetical protein
MGVNMHACICMHGITKAHIVAGTNKHKTQYTNNIVAASKNITAAEWCDVDIETPLHGGKLLFSTQGINRWVIVQAGIPTNRIADKEVQQPQIL